MSQLTYLFTSAPHSSSSGREGVDALLAASAYSENMSVVFIGDGVYQLLLGQQADKALCKDYAPMLKLFELYDIEQVYVCQASLVERGLSQADLIIDVERASQEQIRGVLQQAAKILTF